MPFSLPKSEKEKTILFAFAAALIFIASIQFIARPEIRTLSKLTKEISQVRGNLKKAEALIARKPQMENQMASLQAKLEDIKLVLSHRFDLPNILQDISRIAGESKVKVLKMEPLKLEKRLQPVTQAKEVEGQTPLPIYAQNPVNIEARGSYHGLGEFINRIENSKNLMSIADVEIESNSGDMFNHNIRLLIVVYLLQEEI